MIISGGFIVTVVDEGFSSVARETLFSARLTVYYLIGFGLLMAFVLNRVVLGRYIFAVGNNAEAARLSGVRVGAVAGPPMRSRASLRDRGRHRSEQGSERASGRRSRHRVDCNCGDRPRRHLNPRRRGCHWRTALGIVLLAMIGNGLNLLAVDPIYQQITQGGIILAAAAVDAWTRRRGVGA